MGGSAQSNRIQIRAHPRIANPTTAKNCKRLVHSEDLGGQTKRNAGIGSTREVII